MRKSKEITKMLVLTALVSTMTVTSVLGTTTVNAATLNGKDKNISSQKEEDQGKIIEKVRLRWKNDLTGGDTIDVKNPVIAKKIASYETQTTKVLATMNMDKQKKWLWKNYSNYKKNPAEIVKMLDNVIAMAKAYNLPNNKYYHNEELKKKIIYALDWINENAYNNKVEQYGNWWDWQIGIPGRLNDAVILMYDDLSEKQIKNYMDAIQKFIPRIDPGGKHFTGANLADTCLNKLLQGVISKDPKKIKEASDGIVSVFNYVTNGDGFYPDGSYVQHGVIAYTGSYGAVLINKVSNLMYLLEGTPWAIKSKNKDNIYKWIFDSFDPIVYKGYVMDMVCGRSISRPKDNGYNKTSGIIEGMMKLSMISDEATSRKILSLVKEWANEASSVIDFGTKFKSINSTNKFYKMMKDKSIVPTKQGEHDYELNMMDKTIHERANYSLAISRSSSRISKYEFMNKENLKPWFQGDGMTYLYNSDLTQFSEDFWPTVDPYRLPGTTIDTRKRADKKILEGVDPASSLQDQVYYELTNSNWSGGSSLGKYGVSGMKISNKHDALTANKSWFMFDDEIVALGSGITDKDNYGVETIVENRKIKKDGSNKFVVNGKTEVNSLGDKGEVKNAKWAYLQGNNNDSSIGYYFPKGEDINLIRDKRNGNWLDINKGNASIDKKVSNNYLTMYINHGKDIKNKEYSYVLLPGKSEKQVEEYSKNSKIEILRNDDKVSGVKHNGLNIEAANFWVDGKNTSGSITSNKKSSIIIKEDKDKVLNIAVSDPTFKGDKISVEINKPGVKVISKDDRISNVKLNDGKIFFDVNTKDAGGRSINLAVKLDNNKKQDDKDVVSKNDKNKVENKISNKSNGVKDNNKVNDLKNKNDKTKKEVKDKSSNKILPATGITADMEGLFAAGASLVVAGISILKRKRNR